MIDKMQKPKLAIYSLKKTKISRIWKMIGLSDDAPNGASLKDDFWDTLT